MTDSARMPSTRVAVVSDVHGNAVALEAVLRELADASPDLVVFGGDLTWGPLPEETWALVEPLRSSAIFVSGNAERGLAESAARIDGGVGADLSPREHWMVEQHSVYTRAQLGTFVDTTVVEISGLGAVRFCHGSPRSDEELITFATPETRMRALLEGVQERVLVSAHTHIQFDRTVAGIRSVNPGSVGMPYEGRPGLAFWALLGSDVELRQTPYDLDEAVRRYRATDDPLAEQMVEILVEPPTPQEVIDDSEAREFAGESAPTSIARPSRRDNVRTDEQIGSGAATSPSSSACFWNCRPPASSTSAAEPAGSLTKARNR